MKQAAAAAVVPDILAYAGLDDAEVQVGLAAFAAIGVLSGLAARPTARGAAGRAAESADELDIARRRPLRGPHEARRRAGIAFNDARAHAYPYNEIPIVKPGGGKPYILDSYDLIKGEIVFRRHTQFSEIQFKTAQAYFREFATKYPPGSTIANVPSAQGLAGQRLKGKMFFEVPPQWKAIPEAVLREAARYKIIIRDSNGRVYHAN